MFINWKTLSEMVFIRFFENSRKIQVLLTNFNMDSELPFILLLLGQPDLRETLKRRIHEPLNQRIVLRYHMAGLDQEETRQFVLHGLKVAGRADPLFEENTFELLHRLSLGLPRIYSSPLS